MKQYVVGIGEALWDVLPEGKKLGGAPANFAYHVSQFGLDGLAVSAVGDDPLGDEIINTFEKRKVNFMIDRVPYPTGTVQVEIDPAGIPQYDIKENVAWDNIPYTPGLDDLAKNTRAVCFGSLAQRNVVSRHTISQFLDAVAANGKDPLIVFDVNLRQSFYSKEILAQSMKRSNALKINDEEIVIVSHLFEYPGLNLQDTCRKMIDDFNLDILILTCGVNGSYVFTRELMSFLPTPQVEVADTVGAGDSFTATFIANILKGRSISEAHARAVEVSAYVCTRPGAMPKLPAPLTK